MAGVLHPKCGKRYSGAPSVGHCSGCCETFSGLGAFERHRVGEHGTPERRCEIGPDHWQDDRGYWHVGARLTDEQKVALWGPGL